jgi:carotenoid cleavage dioxygenase-like enzyme
MLDGVDLAAEPVAQIHVPVRIPGGFHGKLDSGCR